MKRVLFYDDVPIYGGHQATAILAAEGLVAAGVEVVSAFPSTNARLHEAWKRVEGAVRLVPIEVRLTRWQPFLSPFGIAARPVRRLLEEIAPDVVVAVQGTIVQSNRAVEQSRRLGIPVVSFIPMGVHFAPGQWLQAAIARVLERYHYRRPDAFITTSENARRELAAGGARARTHVVYCGADLRALRRVPREEARRELAISGFTVAVIGRVSFGTKGHDVAMRALSLLEGDVRLLVVGDGPDDARLGAGVQRLPWLGDMSAVYSAIDMVAIPSRFEGLPQVALEAMFYELPIVAADMGAMREVLPESWLFPVDDAGAMARTVRDMRARDLGHVLAANRERVVRELNAAAFGARFTETLRTIRASR
ncbi:MAG TPA: glycosyltransferase [Thermoanaerobaculia bacterium]|nr:glycosyltransferase [Thermoanaerobaculia bacterium]